jgi:tetratricopeptide (TPR) repeat protein
MRGRILSDLGDRDAAKVDIAKALTLDPNDESALRARWKLLDAEGLHEAALADVDRLIENEEDSDPTFLENSRGLLLTYLGRYVEAANAFAHILEEEPSDYTAAYNLAVAQHRAGDVSAAEASAERVRLLSTARLASTDPAEAAAGHYAIAGLAALKMHRDRALRHLRQALKLWSGVRGWARNDTAWLLLRHDREFQRLTKQGAE